MRSAIRWLGVIPSAVIGLFLGKFAAHYILSVASSVGAFPLQPVPEGAYQVARAFFSPMGMSITAAFAAPRFQRTVGTVLATAWVLLHFGFTSLVLFWPDAFEPVDGAWEWAFVAAVEVAAVVGGLCAIRAVRDLVDPTRDASLETPGGEPWLIR